MCYGLAISAYPQVILLQIFLAEKILPMHQDKLLPKHLVGRMIFMHGFLNSNA